MVLGAAINEYVGIFDMNKILQRVPAIAIPPGANGAATGQL